MGEKSSFFEGSPRSLREALVLGGMPRQLAEGITNKRLPGLLSIIRFIMQVIINKWGKRIKLHHYSFT
jgi:hypothetical protein